MPLITKVPFVSGAVFTPEVATEMTNVIFDDLPQYYGHFSKIADSDLSDAPGSIKTRVANNDLNLKVTAGSGLNANYAAGRALYGTTIFNIGASSISLTASTSNFVYVDIDGVVKNTTSAPPTVRALLAIVTTNTTGVVTVIDEREGYKVEVIRPLATTLQNFGGKGGQGAKSCTNGEFIPSGEYYYTDFFVPAGATITCDRLVYIYCSGNATIQGNIIVTAASKGGSQSTFNVACGFLSAGQGLGGATSERFSNFPYSYKASPVGSGGSSGAMSGNSLGANPYFATTNNGGHGGGGLLIEAANNITITGNITANGTDGDVWYNYVAGGASPIAGDPVIGNVKAKVGGGGGGSGGHINLKCLGNLTVSGALNCIGGRGGNGSTTPDNGNDVRAEAGAGGGGGWVVLSSYNVNTTGSTINVNGGATAAIAGTISPVTYLAYGGTGGSYAGAGGNGNIGDGTAGGIGKVQINSYVPF